MTLVSLESLIGKPVAGMKADIRSRHADGSLQYPDDLEHRRGPILVTLTSVKIEQRGYCCGHMSQKPGQQGKFPWLYWRWEGHGCGYAGHRIDDGIMPPIFLEVEAQP